MPPSARGGGGRCSAAQAGRRGGPDCAAASTGIVRGRQGEDRWPVAPKGDPMRGRDRRLHERGMAWRLGGGPGARLGRDRDRRLREEGTAGLGRGRMQAGDRCGVGTCGCTGPGRPWLGPGMRAPLMRGRDLRLHGAGTAVAWAGDASAIDAGSGAAVASRADGWLGPEMRARLMWGWDRRLREEGTAGLRRGMRAQD